MGNRDNSAKHESAVAGRRPLLDSWHGLLNQLQGRKDSEHEQILIRVGFAVIILAYLLLAAPAGGDPSRAAARLCLLISAGYLAGSLLLLAHILAVPAVVPARRCAGMLLDLFTLPVGMIVGGPLVAPLYPMFLWITFGMGFRYGPRYLFAATGLSVAGFAVVVAATPYWRTQPVLSFALLLALVVLPAYVSTLLTKLTEAVRRAEEASRAKSRFLATMSHELRTPLNAVIGMAELLGGTRLDARQRDMVGTVRGSAQALLGVIDDVLDFSKVEAGRIEVERLPFDLHELLAAVHGILHHQAAAKGLWLRLSVDPRAPYRVRGGARALRQVLLNLIANAIKFTDEGGVTVRLKRAAGGPAGRIRIEVVDTGIGIPAEAQGRVFDSFTQVDEGATRRHGGTGLGLAIARELMQAVDGALGVASTPGRGSTFWLEMPLEPMPEEAAGGRRLEGRVAVVAGDVDFARHRRRLSAWGLEVVRGTDPAVDAAATPDAVVVVPDGLPGGAPRHGRPAAGVAAARFPGTRPPGVVVIGDAGGLDLEADGWACTAAVPPAAGDAELFAAIHAALARPAAAPRPAAPDGLRRAPAAGRRILVAEDNRVNQRVIRGILEGAGHEVRLVEDGERALDALEEAGPGFELVLLDLHMPRMGGVEAAKLYRFTHLDGPRPPLVALTADATAETHRRCAEAGIEHVVTKPVEARRLLELIDRLTAPAARPAPATGGATVVPFSVHAGAARPALDRSRLDMLRALDDSDAFLAEVIDEFIADAEQLADDLEAAAVCGDASRFRELAHALRSSASHVGAIGLVELCAGWRGVGPDELAALGAPGVARLRTEFDRARRALLAERGAAPGGRRA